MRYLSLAPSSAGYVPRRGMETGGRETEGTRICTGGRSTLTLGSVTGGLTGSAGGVGSVGAPLTGGTVGGGVGVGPQPQVAEDRDEGSRKQVSRQDREGNRQGHGAEQER